MVSDVPSPMVIDEPPRGARGRARAWLNGKRFILAALLALVEIAAIIIWRPSLVLAAAAAFIVLVLAVAWATRIGPGIGRDLLWVVAGAQALVVAVPFVLGASVFLGIIIAAVLLVGLAVVLLRMR